MSEETQPNEQPAQDVNLGVADLQNAAQIIDLAVQRGAFKGNEAAQVGQVYNKLAAFVETVTAQQKEQAAETEESTDAETVTE